MRVSLTSQEEKTMKSFPLLAIALILVAAAMFSIFCWKVPAGSLYLKLNAPGVNLEGAMKKEKDG